MIFFYIRCNNLPPPRTRR